MDLLILWVLAGRSRPGLPPPPPERAPQKRPAPSVSGAPLDAPDWRANNVNKRLLSLDLDSDAGREAFGRLAAKADFLLETALPGSDLAAFFDPDGGISSYGGV